MNMQVEQMRIKIKFAYTSAAWQERVDRMSDGQVIAIYYRFLKQGRVQ